MSCAGLGVYSGECHVKSVTITTASVAQATLTGLSLLHHEKTKCNSKHKMVAATESAEFEMVRGKKTLLGREGGVPEHCQDAKALLFVC